MSRKSILACIGASLLLAVLPAPHVSAQDGFSIAISPVGSLEPTGRAIITVTATCPADMVALSITAYVSQDRGRVAFWVDHDGGVSCTGEPQTVTLQVDEQYDPMPLLRPGPAVAYANLNDFDPFTGNGVTYVETR